MVIFLAFFCALSDNNKPRVFARRVLCARYVFVCVGRVYRSKRCRLLAVLCADKLAHIVALYSRLLCKLSRLCLPFADFLARLCIVCAARALGQCLSFVSSDIALNAPQFLLCVVSRHFLPVIFHRLLAHFV